MMAGTISTSGITGAGLKKWMPTTRSAGEHVPAMAATDSDEVLVASRAVGRNDSLRARRRAPVSRRVARQRPRSRGRSRGTPRTRRRSSPASMMRASTPSASSLRTTLLLDVARERCLDRVARLLHHAGAGVREEHASGPPMRRPARCRDPWRRRRSRQPAALDRAISVPESAVGASRRRHARPRRDRPCGRPRAGAPLRARVARRDRWRRRH